MSNYKRLLTIGLTGASVFLLGAPASASDNGTVPYNNEVRSCIAEISDRANYEDATRVRHTVFEVRRRLGSSVLAIDTFVYTDTDDVATREYASICTARGDGKLVKFRISESSEGA